MRLREVLLSGAFSLGVTSLCHAGTIYMTGSDAVRSSVEAAISTAGVVYTAVPTTTTYQVACGDVYKLYSGTLVGGAGTTVIKIHWSGSEAGINDVAAGTLETFIDDSIADGLPHNGAPPVTTIHSVDLAFADNEQVISRTKTPAIATDTKVAVIPYVFVRNNGLWTGTDVCDWQVRAALGGFCQRWVFSGNPANVNDYVYVSGRDNQSGPRVNIFCLVHWGVFTIPTQIEMNAAGTMLDVPLGSGNYAGDFGYARGCALAGTMGANTVAMADLWNGVVGYSVIAYLSRADANTAVANGAVELTYCCHAETPQNVKTCVYPLWGYEHIFLRNSASTEGQNVYNKLVAGIPTFLDGTTAISLTAMLASRNGPCADCH